MDQILEQFLSEARDNLSYLDKNLSKLENADADTINALFRAAHTLKGGAGLVGFVAVKEITHAAEDLLDALRHQKISYLPEFLNVLYEAFDEVVELIDAAEDSGSIDVDVNEAKIEKLKNSIREFLGEDAEDEQRNYSLPFRIADTSGVSLFTTAQLKNLSMRLPLDVTSVDEEFANSTNLWVVDLDIDVDTIRLGNDPFYMFYLIGEENIKAAASVVVNSSELLDWHTRIVAIIEADVGLIEDVFYNVLDEATFAPLSVKLLFKNDFESIASDGAFEDFIEDIKKNQTNIWAKIEALLNVINIESKEGYILQRVMSLQDMVDNKDELLELALKELGIEIEKIEGQKTQKESLSKEQLASLEILKAQKRALKDPSALSRTKLLVKNVFEFLGIQKEIDSVNDSSELTSIIDDVIASFKEAPKIEPEIKLQEPTKKEKSRADDKNINTKKESQSTPKTIKIEQEEIDRLMDIVGEILVVKNSLPYVAAQIDADTIHQSKRELISKYEELNRIVDQLQDRVMGMRLMPISYIFDRYPKLVRDISKMLNKQIELNSFGGETKLDKMMIEKIADPLVHIIRNSLDHGIESPDEREQKGKNPIGKLIVGARSEGDRVFIEIEDDGKGIDIDKVVSKVLEKRLIEPEVLDAMSESEKLMLIFLPGLSTKDEITELSGRGVGTDAVKSVVEGLGGKLYLESKKDIGTKTTIEIPVSVALTNVFHIKLGSANYAIAMEQIVETEKASKERIKTANHTRYISIRGEPIAVVLEDGLLERSELKEEENLLIVKTKTQKVAFIVDEFVGQLDVVQKPLTGTLREHPFISGVSLLGDGSPLFVINMNLLLKE